MVVKHLTSHFRESVGFCTSFVETYENGKLLGKSSMFSPLRRIRPEISSQYRTVHRNYANNVCVTSKLAKKMEIFFRNLSLTCESCKFHELMELRSKCLAKGTRYFLLHSG